jgi:hypothetical protein
VDDDVDPVVERGEIGICHDHRHFDQRVAAQIETGHLAIDPHQPIRHEVQAIRPGYRG